MLLTRGSPVAISYPRPSPAVAELAARSPGRARAHQLDLTDAAACARVATAADDVGVVRTVVCAAGPHVPMTHLNRTGWLALREASPEDVAQLRETSTSQPQTPGHPAPPN